MKNYLLVLSLSVSFNACAMEYVGVKALEWLAGRVAGKAVGALYNKAAKSSGGKKVQAWVDDHVDYFLNKGKYKKVSSEDEMKLIEEVGKHGLKASLLSGKFYDVDLDDVIMIVGGKETDLGSHLDELAKGKEEFEEVQEKFFFRGRKRQLIKALQVFANHEKLSHFVELLQSYPKIAEHVNPFTELYRQGRSLGGALDIAQDKDSLAFKAVYDDLWEQYKKEWYSSTAEVEKCKAFQQHIKEKGIKYVLEVGGLPDEFYELDPKGIPIEIAGNEVDAGDFLDWLVNKPFAGAHILKEQFYCAGQRPLFIQKICYLAHEPDKLLAFLLEYPLATATLNPDKVLLASGKSLSEYSQHTGVLRKALNKGNLQFAQKIVLPKNDPSSVKSDSYKFIIGGMVVGFILGYLWGQDTQEDATSNKEIKV